MKNVCCPFQHKSTYYLDAYRKVQFKNLIVKCRIKKLILYYSIIYYIFLHRNFHHIFLAWNNHDSQKKGSLYFQSNDMRRTLTSKKPNASEVSIEVVHLARTQILVKNDSLLLYYCTNGRFWIRSLTCVRSKWMTSFVLFSVYFYKLAKGTVKSTFHPLSTLPKRQSF